MPKWLKAGAVVLGIAAVTAVPLAQGSSNATPVQRIAALEKKVKVLTNQVNGLNGLAACITKQFAPVGIYGNPPAGDGYVYTQAGKVFPTTAIDATPQGDTPDAILVTVDPACLQGGSRALSKPASSRAAHPKIQFLHLKQSLR